MHDLNSKWVEVISVGNPNIDFTRYFIHYSILLFHKYLAKMKVHTNFDEGRSVTEDGDGRKYLARAE